MPKIKCLTPECPCWISDPCVKTNALFQIRADLLDRLAEAPADKQIPASINQVDSLIESELGFQDIQAQHQLFKKSGTNLGAFRLFTLVCVLGHKNQYNLKC